MNAKNSHHSRSLPHLVNMDSQSREIRIVLLGKTGSGKSATGNTILGYYKESSSRSVTREFKKATEIVDDKEITVVKTLGWCDTEVSEEELTAETVKCIDLAYPGPHVFLLVLRIGHSTEEKKTTVQKIKEVFGEDAVFNNRYENRNQVSTVLKKIQDIIRDNNSQCFSTKTYQLLQKYKAREAELKEQIQAAKREIQAKEAELKRLVEENKLYKEREAELEQKLIHQAVGRLTDSFTILSMSIGDRRKVDELQQQLDKERADKKGLFKHLLKKVGFLYFMKSPVNLEVSERFSELHDVSQR